LLQVAGTIHGLIGHATSDGSIANDGYAVVDRLACQLLANGHAKGGAAEIRNQVSFLAIRVHGIAQFRGFSRPFT
jgi:hypothetical protein